MSSNPLRRLPGPRLRSPRTWTLRARLIAGVVALLLVVCVVISVVSTFFLQGFLSNRLDNELISAAGAVGPPPGSGGGGDPNRGPGTGPPPGSGAPPDGGPPGGGADFPELCTGSTGIQVPFPSLGNSPISVQIFTADDIRGSVREASGCQQSLTPAELAAVNPGSLRNTLYTRQIGTLGTYRLIATHGRGGTGPVIVLGVPYASVNETISTFSVLVTSVGAAALVAAAFAAAAIVRRTLRPLRRVADTASRVAELKLDQGDVALAVRVPEQDTDPRTEVGQVGAALNRMLSHVATALSARQASEMRVRQFVADASHELRTPLAAIRGYAELTRRSNDEVPPNVSHAIRRVESESARMTVLVNDLLLLARLDSGRPLAREQVDMSRLVVDAVSDAHIAGPSHAWRLDLPPDPVVITGDQQRLHQVLANLLSNARTHTPPGTVVTTGLAESNGDVVLTVTDDGPGISPSLQPKEVFERFARADTSRGRTAGSTGLGLAIVQAVVAAHRGDVAVTSEPGNTVFTVLLPKNN